MTRRLLILPLLLASAVGFAEDAPSDAPKEERLARSADAKTEGAAAKSGAKMISGMSILGNQDSPKALVIVPWKSSEIGDAVGLATMLDDSRQPVDKDVFMRELGYYEIRSESSPAVGSAR